jgi:hypothetical protein
MQNRRRLHVALRIAVGPPKRNRPLPERAPDRRVHVTNPMRRPTIVGQLPIQPIEHRQGGLADLTSQERVGQAVDDALEIGEGRRRIPGVSELPGGELGHRHTTRIRLAAHLQGELSLEPDGLISGCDPYVPRAVNTSGVGPG